MRVVHYLNQFFGGVGGEDQAGFPPQVIQGAVGPGRLLDSILSFAKVDPPREAILLLSGNMGRDEIILEDRLITPFASSERKFTQFSPHMLPIDFSIISTLHSHPSGSTRPSPIDLNHFYWRIMIIVVSRARFFTVFLTSVCGEAVLWRIFWFR